MAGIPVLAATAPLDSRDVCLEPPAVAMVWTGPDRPHETVAVPGVVLRRGETLVAIELAMACASDAQVVTGHRAQRPPLVLGHEFVGRVVDVADGVRAVDGATVSIGDRIVWSATVGCRDCDRCRRGLPQRCRALIAYGHERLQPRWELTGGFATHAHLRPGTAIVRVGETLPAEVLAPATCGTATAWAALESADEVLDVNGAAMLVLGAGLVGITACAMASDRGATVVVADPDPARRALAARFGAARTVDPDAPGAIDDALAGIGAPEYEIVLEASGAARAQRAAVDTVGVGGVVVLVGAPSAEALAVDAERLVRELITIRGVQDYAPRHLDRAVGYLRERGTAHPFLELVNARYPLAQIDQALAAAAAGTSVRVAVDPRDARRRR
ncbi:zinc-binding dehydrogenase [Microbacterium album]|nr:alcohol dehydrogenase catalytic domain-containing protein [Microbacterium album]